MNFLMQLLNSQNPMQMLNVMIQKNPNSKNILNTYNQMINGKSQEEIKGIVRNLCNERHIDFNQIEQMVNGRK